MRKQTAVDGQLSSLVIALPKSSGIVPFFQEFGQAFNLICRIQNFEQTNISGISNFCGPEFLESILHYSARSGSNIAILESIPVNLTAIIDWQANLILSRK